MQKLAKTHSDKQDIPDMSCSRKLSDLGPGTIQSVEGTLHQVW